MVTISISKYILLLATLLNFVFSSLTSFKIGETVEENITNNKFYRIELTDRLKEYIIINVKPSDNYEKYSDPDVFVSQYNTYPSNYELAEWYSINLGADMLPIPNSALKDSNYLYVGIKCTNLCQYKLSIYYEDKVELFAGDYYIMEFFGNETSRIFHYNHTQFTTKKFEIFALAAKSEDLTLNVNYVLGSNKTESMNTVQSWYNGWSSVVDTTTFLPCNSCFFRIEITTKVNTQVVLGVNLKNVVNDFDNMEVAVGTLGSMDDRDCYNISSRFNEDMDDKTPFILTVHSYLEHARVYLTSNFGDTSGEKNFQFDKSIVAKLYKSELKDRLLCISPSIDETSYVMTLVKETQIESMQGYNFIVNGMDLYGFLPAGNVTTYKHLKIDLSSSTLNLDLKVISGNPILYAYICMDHNDCFFNKEKVEAMASAGSFFSSFNVNDNYHIGIPNEINACAEKMKTSQKKDVCSAIAIVYCQGDVECQYTVSMSFDKDIYLLTNKVKTSRFVPKGYYNYFKIQNDNPSVQKISVIVHSHTGDSDMYASRTNSHPEEDENKIYSNSIGNRDTIEFENIYKENVAQNNSLIGDFYIAVKGFTSSYYTIYYYTNMDTNSEQTYRQMESGYIYPENVSKDDKIKIFRFVNSEIDEKTPFLITFNSINCEGDTYFMQNEITQEVSFKIDSNFHHSQYLVTPDMDFFKNKFGYNFGFKVTNLDSSSSSTQSNCLVYVGGIEKDKDLVLNEGVPHILTLNNNESMNYIYPHAFSDNSAIINIYFEQVGKIQVKITIGTHEFSLVIFKPKGILISKDLIKKNCNSNPCNIKLNIQSDSSNYNPVTYKVVGKSLNDKPIYVKKGLLKHDSIIPSVYQYYSTDIIKGDSGEIHLQVAKGNAVLVGKIVRTNQPEEVNADYLNVKLPKLEDFNNLVYNPNTMSISFNSTDTEICQDGCQIYFGVYSKDKFSYNDYLVDYTVYVKTDNRITNLPLDFNTYGKVNNTNALNLYNIKIKDNVDRVTFTLDCLESPCEILVNYGEKVPTKTSSTWRMVVDPGNSNILTISTEDNFLKGNRVTNLKDAVFTIGVGSTISDSIQYHLYATAHVTGANQIYDIIPATPQVCQTIDENSYCDFVMHLTEDKPQKLMFYTKYISTYKTRDLNIQFYTKTVNYTDYFLVKNGQISPPRPNDYEVYSNGNYGKPIFNYTTTGKETLLLLSIKYNHKGTYTLLSNVVTDFKTPIQNPKVSLDYLIYLTPLASTDLKLGSADGTYMVNFFRVIGNGEIEYAHKNKGKGLIAIDKNSTTSQISIQEDNVDLIIANTNPYKDLVLIFKYEPNLVRNFDEIHLGPSQTIHYPNDKGGFPISYYLPLRDINLDITINIVIKNIQYKGDENNDEYFPNHKIHAGVMKKDNIYSLVKNKKFTGLPEIYGFHQGAYDNSLRTARITIPAGKYSNDSYVVLNLIPDKHFERKAKSFEMQVLAFPENSLSHNITLPQKIYYYSMINTNQTISDTSKENQVRHGHVYKLQREHPNEKFMVIELASCSGEVNYAIRDVDPSESVLIEKNPALLLNRTKHSHVSYEHYGKKIVEINLEDTSKDVVLVVFPRGPRLEAICDDDNNCEIDTNVEYAVKYRSFVDRSEFEKYEILDKGLVSSFVEENSNSLFVKGGTISNTKSLNSDTKVTYYIRLFKNEYNRKLSQYDSICFAHSTEKVYKFVDHPSKYTTKGFELTDFPVNKDYVVSILSYIQDKDENYGTLLVYNPITSIIKTGSGLMTILSLLVSFILLIIVWIIYRKFRLTKLQLEYETNDVRNLASIPKSSMEVAEMRKMNSKEKYTTLSDSNTSSINM